MDSKFTLQTASLSHRGLVRENNEDSLVVDQGLGLFLLADGMGGYQAGEIASRIAVDTIAKKIASRSSSRKTAWEQMLLSAFAAAHQEIRKKSYKSIEQRGMGSTAVVASLDIDSKCLWVAHVGDSRAYLLRNGDLLRLTEDHTIYNQALQAGLLPADPESHPPRSMLSQALGKSDVIAPAVARLDLQAGDTILLCSDGLTDMVDEVEISRLLLICQEPVQICEALVQEALTQGGKDNVTVIVVKVSEYPQG